MDHSRRWSAVKREAVRGLVWGVVLAVSGASGVARGQGAGMEDVRIETVELGSGLAMLVGRGGNIGLSAGPDGVFLIDDQFAPLTPKIRAAVAARGAGPVRFVLNTHWHGDHTGGNENLAGDGALIVAHENVRRRMGSDQFMEALDRHVPASPPAALPVITFTSDVTFHLNGQTVHAIHVDPAHTDGDSIVHFRPANVIHAGDVYVAGMYPFVDRSSGGRIAGFVAAADRMLDLADDDTRIIPGHGPLSNRAELAEWRAMLVDVEARVRAAVEAGRPLEDVVADRPTRKWDARYGNGFVKPEFFVRAVYRSLAEGP